MSNDDDGDGAPQAMDEEVSVVLPEPPEVYDLCPSPDGEEATLQQIENSKVGNQCRLDREHKATAAAERSSQLRMWRMNNGTIVCIDDPVVQVRVEADPEQAAREQTVREAEAAQAAREQAARADVVKRFGELCRLEREAMKRLIDIDHQAAQFLEAAENNRAKKTKRAEKKATIEFEKIRLKQQKVELAFHETCTALDDQIHQVQTEQHSNVSVAQAQLADAGHAKNVFFQEYGIQLSDVVNTASLEEDRNPVEYSRPRRTLYKYGEGEPSIAEQVIEKSKPFVAKGPGPW